MLRTSANTIALSGSTEPAMAENMQPTVKKEYGVVISHHYSKELNQT